MADKRLGSDELFAEWIEWGLKDLVVSEDSLLAALKKMLGNEGYIEFQMLLKHTVLDMFVTITDFGHGIVFCHSPLVEMFAEAYGQNMDGVQLNSCEGIMLEQGNVKNIVGLKKILTVA